MVEAGGYPQSQAIRRAPMVGSHWSGRGGGPHQWTHQSNCRVSPGSTRAGPRSAPVRRATRLAGAGPQSAPGWTLVKRRAGKEGCQTASRRTNIGNHTWKDKQQRSATWNQWDVLQRKRVPGRRNVAMLAMDDWGVRAHPGNPNHVPPMQACEHLPQSGDDGVSSESRSCLDWSVQWEGRPGQKPHFTVGRSTWEVATRKEGTSRCAGCRRNLCEADDSA